ncbi:1-phosphatidylinositol- -bisphosphate phosphodiesterase gamma-1, partial [Lasius niger]
MIGVMGEKVMRRISDEMGKMREEIRQWEEKWRKKKREMKEKIQGLGTRIQEMEEKLKRKIKEGGSFVVGVGRGGKEEIGAKVEIEEVRRVGRKYGKERGMVVVKLGSRKQKRDVMEKKKGLKGKKIRIEDDLTWEERKIRWKIREIAEEKRRKGSSR